jgi:hypothetical protein
MGSSITPAATHPCFSPHGSMGLDSSCRTSLTAPAGHLLPRHLQQLQAPRTAIHVREAGTKAATRTAAPSLHLQLDSKPAWAAPFSTWQHHLQGSSKGRACSIKPHPGGNKKGGNHKRKKHEKKKCRLVRSF